MDFLTAFPYWAILVIMIVNAIAVQFMKIDVQDDEKEKEPTK
ncbi:hypothetical protein [Spirosoma spitsbergense]|jgi:hypothetical protein|nr:hypothetical protein [Spirosoma spitsbergense]